MHSPQHLAQVAQVRELRGHWKQVRIMTFVGVLALFGSAIYSTIAGLLDPLFLTLTTAVWLVLTLAPVTSILQAFGKHFMVNFMDKRVRLLVDLIEPTIPFGNIAGSHDIQLGWLSGMLVPSYQYYYYWRPLQLMQRAYEDVCKRAGREPYPFQRHYLIWVPLLFAALYTLLSVVFGKFGGADSGLLSIQAFFSNLVLTAALFSLLQLIVHGLLLDRVEELLHSQS